MFAALQMHADDVYPVHVWDVRDADIEVTTKTERQIHTRIPFNSLHPGRERFDPNQRVED